ncbi:MAG: inositol-3-phosphate synthase [Alphaproteobacteria bacterium GM202ARS2]|nr:inositol-3-phosphate synthase [Alphaproteobacteria bacterium GM202ARS2]
MPSIKIALAGIGNCASSLLQGIQFYKDQQLGGGNGLAHEIIGGYTVQDIVPVAAFDIDRRKVTRPLREAVFAPPNCTTVFESGLPDYDVIVKMGPVLDSCADHLNQFPETDALQVAEEHPVNLAEALRDSGAHVLLCYLPVGSEQAVRAYADACVDAGVAMVNCVPVFLASDEGCAALFREAGVPIVGDDIKSQFGTTIVHRQLVRMLRDRGIQPKRTYQLNVGGNTDFMNMLARSRLVSKKQSKTEAVQSQLEVPLDATAIHVGPSDYVPWMKDNKVGFVRIEWEGFGGVPMHLELRLSVEDSPNSAGVAIDALRYAKVALDRGIGGPLEAASAYLMKRPPRQMRDDEARLALANFVGSE